MRPVSHYTTTPVNQFTGGGIRHRPTPFPKAFHSSEVKRNAAIETRNPMPLVQPGQGPSGTGIPA